MFAIAAKAAASGFRSALISPSKPNTITSFPFL
jgi:hypothetical protein